MFATPMAGMDPARVTAVTELAAAQHGAVSIAQLREKGRLGPRPAGGGGGRMADRGRAEPCSVLVAARQTPGTVGCRPGCWRWAAGDG